MNWIKYLKMNSVVLDLGCGSGWLSAFLSMFNIVSSVYALELDSSRSSIESVFDTNLPTVKNIRENR